MEEDDRAYHLNKRPDRTYVSKSFKDRLMKEKMRIASKVIDSEEGIAFVQQQDEITLRTTAKGRQEIKAAFFENDRRITTLTIQKFNAVSGPSDRQHFSFIGKEITTLIEFLFGVNRLSFADDQKFHISDEALREIVLNDTQARRIFSENQELFLDLAQNENLKRDLVAVGYRRSQLERFEKLLHDQSFFESERRQSGRTPEAVWQHFFEANTWIFGYGLSYQFLTGLDGCKLEQTTQGHSIGGSGKRVDALMKTQARINSLCFVEIKRHDTDLLASKSKPYRADAWAPSSELCGGVAQVQATVQSFLEKIGLALSPKDEGGWPTRETLFNIEPRAFLVIGRLDEFRAENGINELQYRSFELYRRNVKRPEILTFDELLFRARFIVNHGEN